MITVFLDLDGTLSDSAPGITRSMQHALAAMGAPVPEADALRWCIGPPLRDNLRALLGPGADIEAAAGHFHHRYGTIGWQENALYDGVPEMLDALVASGCTLHLATSKSRRHAERIVAHFGIRPRLGAVFAANDDGTGSEKPDLLAHALRETGTDPARAVMLGDREHDMKGAAANAIAGIGALWGFGNAAELTGAGAQALAASPAEAAGLILARIAAAGA
ncbi:MAG: HAD family hydrolase [Alphaproteobacteria bacterium]|nr:MAG: HAD family hydrolase [Alphaproteobacteria bacterium]